MTKRSDDELIGRFARWFGEREEIDEVVRCRATRPRHGGMSSTTLLVHADCVVDGAERGEDLVVRVDAPLPLFPDDDAARQAGILRALATSDIPVPTVRFVEPDPGVLGRPFLVTERVVGRIPADDPPYQISGWLADATPAEQARVQHQALATLARINTTEAEDVGLETLRRVGGRDALASDIEYWDRYLDWAADGERVAVVDEALARCRSERPATDDASLCWGDARLGNLVFDDRGEVAAVLDWEMATVGPLGLDLGWMLFAEVTAQHWLEPLPGFRSIADAAGDYAAMLGVDIELDWYLAWGGLRAAAVLVRLAHRARLAGDADAWRAASDNPVTTVLCDRLGFPEPSSF